jgi:transcriptional regulator with XRE-family HTH domain
MDDYELRAAPGNPDLLRLTPEQLEQQVQVVGKWEQSKRIPDMKRLTWWYPDFGVFVKKEFITDAELSGRYEKVMESKAHATQKMSVKKPIAERLKEGAEQAERDNASHPVPPKNMEKNR